MGWDAVRAPWSLVWPGQLGNRQDLLARAITRGAPLVTALLALAFYVSTLANDITWRNFGGDGGELITASMTLGVAHPPGYPLYILIGRLFGFLPFASVAARYSLLSAVAAAAGIGLAVRCMTIRRPVGSRTALAALAVGLSLALTPLIWSQAIITEVYALTFFFVALFMWAVLADRSPMLIGLAFGLAVSAHLTSMFLLPIGLWAIGKSGLLRFIAGAALGLTPFLLLPLLSSGSSPVIWGDSSTISGWWWQASAALYRANVFGLPPSQWSARLADWQGLGVLLPLLLWFFLASSFTWLAWRHKNRQQILLFATALLYTAYAFTYRPDDSAVLLLPALLLSAIIVGRGLNDSNLFWSWLLVPFMLGLSLLALPPWSDVGLRDKALARMELVPSSAIVLTPGDATISALWYLHHVEGHRPDIIVVDANMFQFTWYRQRLQRDFPALWVPEEDDLDAFIASSLTNYPVCQLSLSSSPEPECVRSPLEAFHE